jgi:hypothetical protein
MSVDVVLSLGLEVKRAIEIALGLVFALSSATKVYRPRAFVRAVAAYELLPRQLVVPFSAIVITAEVALAATLLGGAAMAVAAPTAVALLSTFMAAVAMNLWRGRHNACGCFGADDRISGRTVARLAALLAAAAIAWLLEVAAAPRVQTASPSLLIEDVSIGLLLLLGGLWALSLPELIRLSRFVRAGALPDRQQNTRA